jgi:hypothetical protein
MLDKVAANLPNDAKVFRLLFSATPFPAIQNKEWSDFADCGDADRASRSGDFCGKPHMKLCKYSSEI